MFSDFWFHKGTRIITEISKNDQQKVWFLLQNFTKDF